MVCVEVPFVAGTELCGLLHPGKTQQNTCRSPLFPWVCFSSSSLCEVGAGVGSWWHCPVPHFPLLCSAARHHMACGPGGMWVRLCCTWGLVSQISSGVSSEEASALYDMSVPGRARLGMAAPGTAEQEQLCSAVAQLGCWDPWQPPKVGAEVPQKEILVSFWLLNSSFLDHGVLTERKSSYYSCVLCVQGCYRNKNPGVSPVFSVLLLLYNIEDFPLANSLLRSSVTFPKEVY